jgi:hypothetical protein
MSHADFLAKLRETERRAERAMQISRTIARTLDMSPQPTHAAVEADLYESLKRLR